MTLLSIEDRIESYRNKFKESAQHERVAKLTKLEIKEMLKLQAETDIEIFEAAVDPRNGFNGINLGYGKITVVPREPMKFRNVHTGEEQMTTYSPLFYFRPTPKFKSRIKFELNDVMEKQNLLNEDLQREGEE